MATQLVIGLVGMPASGKTVVADYLAKRFSAHRIHLGNFIWEFLAKRGVKPSTEMGLMASLYMWAEYGDVPITNWAYKQLQKVRNKKLVVLDSLRTMEEAQFFQDKLRERFHLIAVLASPSTRLKREQARGRFGKVTKVEFRMRDKEELRLGVGDLIASSNHYIEANSTIPAIKKHVDKILKQIRS